MLYSSDYYIFLIAILLCMLISAIASGKVRSAYSKYSRQPIRSGLSGYDTANRLLRYGGVSGISVGRIGGSLTDHYNPTRGSVNLSESTYDGRSVASVAVAAHEIGHVMQKQTGYGLYRIRTALVPVVNIGSRLSFPLVLIGLLLDGLAANADPDLGFHIALIGVILYGGSFLFALVTLPVELDASRRAKEMLLESGILAEDEIPGASKVLSAAAMTYLASLLTSLVYFLRFLVQVLTLFGRRDNRR